MQVLDKIFCFAYAAHPNEPLFQGGDAVRVLAAMNPHDFPALGQFHSHLNSTSQKVPKHTISSSDDTNYPYYSEVDSQSSYSRPEYRHSDVRQTAGSSLVHDRDGLSSSTRPLEFNMHHEDFPALGGSRAPQGFVGFLFIF